MASLKLPSRNQLLIASTLWFMISIGFQAAQVYRTTNFFNVLDVCVSAIVMLVAVFFVSILQKFTSGFFNNLYTRMGMILLLVAKVLLLEKYLIGVIVQDPGYFMVFKETVLIRGFSAFLIISFYSATLWFVYHVKKLDREYALKKSAENALRNAELLKLRQQIQPHFLFNSLNSINALVGTQPAQARKMIQNLSDFLRGTLKTDENKPVKLEEEIDLLKLYLDIEKVRFGHRLDIQLETDAEHLQKMIPPLLLQPLVENAIKFGLYNVLDNVEIKIASHLQNNLLALEVTNPFDENTAVTRKGEGFGLSTIQRRLQLIYHRADLLRIERNHSLFKVTILIPQP